ncbi:hypothetical protein EDB87DRAFT_941482 [Lactarius vividus]|nr:hypothetical protein EDB87DRAFT_941482 [Lactarius vividus]
METIQSNIRDGIKLGRFPGPVKAEAFRAYAIAGSMGLDPELEDAARLTLGYLMTFESLGEQLRSFKGRSLCDLIRYRKSVISSTLSRLSSVASKVHTIYATYLFLPPPPPPLYSFVALGGLRDRNPEPRVWGGEGGAGGRAKNSDLPNLEVI